VLCALLATACTTCHDRLIQSADGGQALAEVHERHCGSIAGFVVRIIPHGERYRDGYASDFEPFNASCRCTIETVRQFVVTVAWSGPNSLEIRYSGELPVMRSESAWKGLQLTYVPVTNAKQPGPGA